MKLKLFAASPRVLRIVALKHHLALGCEVQPIDLGRGDQPISQYGTLSQRLALAHPARSAYARFLVLSERTGLIGKVANGSRAVNRRANGGCLSRADRARTAVASGRTGVRAIAIVPLGARSRLHQSNFPQTRVQSSPRREGDIDLSDSTLRLPLSQRVRQSIDAEVGRGGLGAKGG